MPPQVGMKMQILPPAMQHREETEFHAQTLRIACHGKRGLGGGAEEDIVVYTEYLTLPTRPAR